jgi:hypothetical protein
MDYEWREGAGGQMKKTAYIKNCLCLGMLLCFSPKIYSINIQENANLNHNELTIHSQASVQVASDWQIKFVGQIRLGDNTEIIGDMGFLSVTDDEWLIISDPKDKNIKLFDPKGKFVASWGRKGQGPGEFGSIGILDYRKPYLTVTDPGKMSVHIYERKAASSFQNLLEISNIQGGSPLARSAVHRRQIIFDALARAPNGEPFHLYMRSLDNATVNLILPWPVRYGLTSHDDYMKKHAAYARELGMFNSCFDFNEDNIFYIWEGELRVINININLKTWSFFGKETENYIRPRLSYSPMRPSSSGKTSGSEERHKVSRILGIFADDKMVIICYANPAPDLRHYKAFLQFYDIKGSFLKELVFSESDELINIARYVYNRENRCIYVPITMIDEQGRIDNLVKKYQIIQK